MPKSRKLATDYTSQSPIASYGHRIPTATKTFTYLWDLLMREYLFGISSSNLFMKA